MSRIAIVGSAEVVIRALGNKLEGDIQDALNRGARGARGSGRNAGREFGDGLGDGIDDSGGVSQHIRAKNKDIDQEGERVGRRLGDQIGKGVQRSRMQATIIRSLLKLSIITPVIAGLVGGISTLVSGLFALTAAAGNASASLIVLPGILSALGAGLIATTTGFNGVGKAVAAGFDPSKVKQFNKELNNLPVASQKFVKELVKMRDGFKGIQAAAAEGLFDGPNGLTARLKEIEPLLPTIAGGFRATGQAVRDGLGSALDRLTTPAFFENLEIVASTNNHVIRELGKTFGNVFAGIIAVVSAASPVIVQFSEWMTDLTQRFRESREAAAGDNSLTNYFLLAADVAKVFIDIVKNVSEGLHDIGKIAFPFGLDIALGLRDATEEFANFTDKAENITRLQNAFAAINDNTEALGALVRDLGAAFLRLGASPDIGKISEAIRNIIPDIEAALVASQKAAPAIVQLVGGLARLFKIFAESGTVQIFATVLSAFASAITGITDNVPLASAALKSLIVAGAGLAVVFKVGSFFGFFNGLKTGSFILKGLGTAFSGLGRIVAGIGPAFRLLLSPMTLLSKLGGVLRIVLFNLSIAIRLIGAAISANPVGALVIGIIALATAFSYAWKHSETFRKIVVGALKVVIGYFQFLLTTWTKALRALSKVPGFGWTGKIADKMQAVNKKLDQTKTKLDEVARKKVNTKVTANTKPAAASLNNFKNKNNGYRINGVADINTDPAKAKLEELRALMASAGLKVQGVKATRKNTVGVLLNPKTKRSKPSDAAVVGVGGDSGGGGDSGSSKEKKEKPEVDFGPVKEAIKKTADDIRSAIDSFVDDVRETKDKSAIKEAESLRKRIEPYLKVYETVSDKITKFGERVKEVQQSLIDRNNIFTREGGTDIASLTGSLQKNAQEAADFAAAVRDLRGAGLNNKLLQQFVQAGPDALARAASILRSGPAGIAQLNKSINQVSSAGEKAGKESAASTLNAGKLSADAFIQGLKDQKKTLQKQFSDIALNMGKDIGKALKDVAELKNFPSKGSNQAGNTKSPAKLTTANKSNSVKITQIYNGPSTGSSRNRELDWTLRYGSATSAPDGGAGNVPLGVDR